MNFPEQADSSAEHAEDPSLFDLLRRERDTVGSTRAYLRALGVYYQSVPEHRPNMLQLQRIATMVTNPTNEPSYPQALTDAFYWGEILAYNTQKRLIGEEWSQASYRMLNESMVKHLAELRDDDLSHFENMMQTATIMMGDLETVDAYDMPPAMDQLIQQWASEITDDEEQQWQIVLGFRYIIIEVVEKALEDAERDDNDALSVAERARISNQFFNLVSETDINDVQGIEPVPIDDARVKIMQIFAAAVAEYGAYDASDEDELDRMTAHLTEVMQHDFDRMEEVKTGDFMHIGGRAAYILYSEEAQSQDVYILRDNEFLEGTVDAVAVVETPTNEALRKLREDGVIDEDEIETTPAGVVMVLKDSVLINDEGKHLQIGGDQVAGLILSNDDMHMSKYLL